MSDSRTLEPTLRRRQQARKEGRVPATRWLGAAITWLALFVVGHASSDWLVARVESANANASQANVVAADLSALFVPGEGANDRLIPFVREQVVRIAFWLVPCLLAGMILAILGRIAQVGFIWVPQKIAPDFSRLQPKDRSGGSLDGVMQVVRGLALVALILGLTALAIWEGRETLEVASVRGVASSIRFVCRWGLRVGGVMLLFALFDYAYQYRRFEDSLKMTTEEMRAEVKAIEGSGALAAQRRKQYQQATS